MKWRQFRLSANYQLPVVELLGQILSSTKGVANKLAIAFTTAQRIEGPERANIVKRVGDAKRDRVIARLLSWISSKSRPASSQSEARSSYEKALALTQQEPARQFLQERIRQ